MRRPARGSGDERASEVRQPDVGPHERDRVLQTGHAVRPAFEVAAGADAVDRAGVGARRSAQTVERAGLVHLVGVDDEEVVGREQQAVVVGLPPHLAGARGPGGEVHRAVPTPRLVRLTLDEHLDPTVGVEAPVQQVVDGPIAPPRTHRTSRCRIR